MPRPATPPPDLSPTELRAWQEADVLLARAETLEDHGRDVEARDLRGRAAAETWALGTARLLRAVRGV